MQLPQGIVGWTLFGVGLLIIAYRIRGVDSPRGWVEGLERKFTDAIRMKYIGGILLAAAGVLGYFAGAPVGILGWLCLGSLILVGLVGFCMLFLQNHLRHIVFASAESSDKMLRIVSIAIVLVGLGLTIAPFLL